MITKWDYNKLLSEAAKYKTRKMFRKNNVNAYKTAHRWGILDQICAHMTYMRIYWSEEMIQKEALRFTTRGEFKANSLAYKAAIEANILDKVYSHMEYVRTYWTLDSLLAEALKYNTRDQFRLGTKAYSVASRMKLMDQFCSHMKRSRGTSLMEQKLFDFIKGEFPSTVKFRDKTADIPGKPYIRGFEIDIYIPELKKGIEFDGTYYHSLVGLRQGRPNWPQKDLENYHQIKDDYFKSKGIEILHIKEKDWLKDKEECFSKCIDFLKKVETP